MLLFYSAECGLKSLLIRRSGQKDTGRVGAQYGHNLRGLIAEAKISRAEIQQPGGGAINFPDLKEKTGNSISLTDFHVAMRYGIELEQNSQDATFAFLGVLTSALRKRLF